MIRFHLSCKRRNCINMNTVTILAQNFTWAQDNECLGMRLVQRKHSKRVRLALCKRFETVSFSMRFHGHET